MIEFNKKRIKTIIPSNFREKIMKMPYKLPSLFIDNKIGLEISNRSINFKIPSIVIAFSIII